MNPVETVALEGCRPEPLAQYLKGLGAFRVLVEQGDELIWGSKDPPRARWQGNVLALVGEGLRRESVEAFLLDRYRPTPIVSPWNKASGFDGNPTPELGTILDSDDPRLHPYRSTIRAAREVADRASEEGLGKEEVLLRCRAWLPDEAVAWLDAAVVLTDAGAAFPPLLGTGGNLGRLELSRNYMAHVARVLGLGSGRRAPSRDDIRAWLRAALFDEGSPRLVKAPIAQYDPGPAGGANMAPDGKAESVVNPWDFVLVLEGALLFASAAARRMGTDIGGTSAMPFTTSNTRVGYASSSAEEPARGELWAPVWSRALSFSELSRLMAEGRAEWRGRQARSGLDFVRAVGSLGTDRGIDHFVRHAFVERLGQMALAVPVGVVAVRERPQVALLGQLDPWLDRVRRGTNPPGGVRSDLRAVDEAMFHSATSPDAPTLQRLLLAVAALHRSIERSNRFRQRIGPLSDLVADHWLPLLDDRTNEFAVALSLASAKDRDGWALRSLLAAVHENHSGHLEWTARPALVSGLGVRPVQEVIAEALQAHALLRSRSERTPESVEEFDHIGHGLDLSFMYQRTCVLGVALRAGLGELDADQLSQLLDVLLLLNWRPRDGATPYRPRAEEHTAIVLPEAALVLPCFHGRGITFRGRRLLLRADPSWPRLLAAGDVRTVAGEAARRLRMAGLAVAVDNPSSPLADGVGPWLGVAALCRLPNVAVVRLLEHVVPPEIE